MPSIREQIDQVAANFETDFFDPKLDCLIRYIDHPELFEHMFPDPPPSREEQMRRVIGAILS